MSLPIITIHEGYLHFGEKILFNNLNLSITQGEKTALVGSNGAGKSTLIKLIAGMQELSSGRFWKHPDISIGYLPQSLNVENTEQTIAEFVCTEQKLQEEEKYKIDIIADKIKIDVNKKMRHLSGGELRKVALCSALLSKRDLLLLDEPTNHLDIASIEWLEEYISSMKCAIICISHDRTFLKNISNKVLWLDRGSLKTLNKGYENFEEWSLRIIEEEQREAEKLNKKMEAEELWLRQGVTARRKRNQGRLRELYALREKIKHQHTRIGELNKEIDISHHKGKHRSPKIAVEFHKASKQVGSKKIVTDFSWRLIKGEKIGIIGPNGAGKTSFLKLLVGDIQPDSGTVKRANKLEVTYMDQRRTDVDPTITLWKFLASGEGDHIKVGDKQLHVVAYLKKFLFDPKIAKDKIATLSGGQRNRLLLAKSLATPGDLLILDEPTNDLDTDTLDMLQEILFEYKGTLLVVSHDRDFLDKLVTKTLVFDNSDNPKEYIGGYTDYAKNFKPAKIAKTTTNKAKAPKTQQANKPSYKVVYEYKQLPNQIEKLEAQMKSLEEELAELAATSKTDEIVSKSKELSKVKQDLEYKENRWLELSLELED